MDFVAQYVTIGVGAGSMGNFIKVEILGRLQNANYV